MRKFANGEEVQVFSETTGKWEDTFVMEYIGDCDVTVMPNMKRFSILTVTSWIPVIIR